MATVDEVRARVEAYSAFGGDGRCASCRVVPCYPVQGIGQALDDLRALLAVVDQQAEALRLADGSMGRQARLLAESAATMQRERDEARQERDDARTNAVDAVVDRRELSRGVPVREVDGEPCPECGGALCWGLSSGPGSVGTLTCSRCSARLRVLVRRQDGEVVALRPGAETYQGRLARELREAREELAALRAEIAATVAVPVDDLHGHGLTGEAWDAAAGRVGQTPTRRAATAQEVREHPEVGDSAEGGDGRVWTVVEATSGTVKLQSRGAERVLTLTGWGARFTGYIGLRDGGR